MKHCNKNLTFSILFLILAVSFVFVSKEKNVIRDIKKVGFDIQRLEMDLTDNQATVYAKWINKTPLTVLSVPLYYQKYSLSCEIASLRMALAYKGVLLPEDTLIADLEFDTKNPPTRDQKTNRKIWGDPNKGFVGIINGKMPLTGYGVYSRTIPHGVSLGM